MRIGFSRRRRGGRAVILCLVLLAALLVFLLIKLQPAFIEYAERYADNIANKIVNNAVQKVCENDNYSNLSEVRDGSVKTVETDTQKINRIRTELNSAMLDTVNNTETVYVPLGSVTGLYFLSGIGPKIPVRVSSAAVVSTDLRDEFTSAGINQVCHRIYVDTAIELSFMGLGASDTKTVTVTAPLCETVIVGDTPQYYGAGELAVN